MPKASNPTSGLSDTWGRKNRSLSDKQCPHCGVVFRPLRASSTYCSRPCMWANNGGRNKKAESWWINQRGYVEGRIWLKDGTSIRVKQHRFIAEGIIGRPLNEDEDVHHKNGIKTDNRPENLEVINHGSHSIISNLNRKYKKGYKLNLTPEQRKSRSLNAIAMRLADMGRTAIAHATGKEQA